MSNVTVISHSEVETYLSCKRKHWFAFGDSTHGPQAGLEPKTFSDSLFRGIQGHDALSVFFTAIKNGGNTNDAAESVRNHLNMIGIRPEVFTKPNHLAIVTDLNSRILPRFFNNEVVQLLDKGWFPQHVEETFRLRLEFPNGVFVYPFRPDAIMRDQAGNLWVWDHKFIYNFYSEQETNLLPQIPKYIGSLRAMGMYIKGGYYNMLRWREVKDESAHVKHSKVTPSDKRVQNAFRQQYEKMVEIGELKQDPDKWDQESSNSRVLSTMVCKSCSFKSICATELNGEDATLAKRVDFNANSYGYTETGE